MIIWKLHHEPNGMQLKWHVIVLDILPYNEFHPKINYIHNPTQYTYITKHYYIFNFRNTKTRTKIQHINWRTKNNHMIVKQKLYRTNKINIGKKLKRRPYRRGCGETRHTPKHCEISKKGIGWEKRLGSRIWMATEWENPTSLATARTNTGSSNWEREITVAHLFMAMEYRNYK